MHDADSQPPTDRFDCIKREPQLQRKYKSHDKYTSDNTSSQLLYDRLIESKVEFVLHGSGV